MINNVLENLETRSAFIDLHVDCDFRFCHCCNMGASSKLELGNNIPYFLLADVHRFSHQHNPRSH